MIENNCFTSDTKILLFTREKVSLEELSDRLQPFRVLSIKEGKIVASKATAHKIMEEVSLIKITLNRGYDNKSKEIICACDHKFMLKDKSYKMAKDLTNEDELMSLDRNLNILTDRIDSIEEIEEKQDVYCLKVDKYHNFALASGIFVEDYNE